MNRIVSTIGLGVLLFAGLSSAALANCKPGTGHCIMAGPSIPKFCGSVSKPCVIDGGLGSTCKGDVVCGTGQSSPIGDPPYGTNLSGGATTFFVRSGNGGPQMPHAFGAGRLAFRR